jgi:hypothetical protein
MRLLIILLIKISFITHSQEIYTNISTYNQLNTKKDFGIGIGYNLRIYRSVYVLLGIQHEWENIKDYKQIPTTLILSNDVYYSEIHYNRNFFYMCPLYNFSLNELYFIGLGINLCGNQRFGNWYIRKINITYKSIKYYQFSYGIRLHIELKRLFFKKFGVLIGYSKDRIVGTSSLDWGVFDPYNGPAIINSMQLGILYEM